MKPMFDVLARKDESTRIAVVGASNNRMKYGNIITRMLARMGYTVWPVNPHEPEVEGIRCYPTVGDLPETPDIVNVVTPPSATLAILRQCEAAGVPNVWLQPGSYDGACLREAAQGQYDTEHDACIMVEARRI